MTNKVIKKRLNVNIQSENQILLHDIEICPECSKRFLSLYPFKECHEHKGEIEI